MAKAIGRLKPYSGEQVRRYENAIDEPGNEARRALSLVFGRTEQYIEFGSPTESGRQATAHLTPKDAQEESLLFIFRGLFPEQKREEILNLMALAEANRWAREKRGVKAVTGNEQVRAHYGDVADLVKAKARKRKLTPNLHTKKGHLGDADVE